MLSNDYYIATRNPSLGGLQIIESNEDFPKDVEEIVKENCLELIAPAYGVYPVAIYPVENGKVIVSVAHKIEGDENESRPHEMIYGNVIDVGQMCCAMEDVAEPSFCNMFIENLGTSVGNKKGDGKMQLDVFFARLGARNTIGLYHAVKNVIQQRKKIQLAVVGGKERIVQAALHSVIGPVLGNRLFTISNGECTQNDADILITREIKYQEEDKYERLTLNQFIEWGNSLTETHLEAQYREKEEELISKCIKYIENPKATELTVCEVRCAINEMERADKKRFQTRLKCRLAKKIGKKKQSRHYIQILLLVYEMSSEDKILQEGAVLTAPYNLSGVINFLQAHCTRKWHFKRYVDMLVTVWVEAFQSMF